MAQMYTYNPLTGLSAGTRMISGAPVPQNPSRKAPPHLSLGLAGFIGVNTRWSNAQFVSGRLLRSSLTTIEPQNGRPFQVFDTPRQDDDFVSLIYIDVSMPAHMKRRADTDLNAWTGIRGEGIEVIKVDTTTGAALLRCEPNAQVELFQFDGSVHLLSVVNGKVSTVSLTQKQMAVLRVEQFEEQIATLDLSLERDVRRLHGISAGALRLVPVVKETAALDVLVDFFTAHQATLTDNLRKQIRWALTDAGHPASSTFLDGFEAVNVFQMNKPDGAAKRAVADKKRRDRASNDRQRTMGAKERAGKSQGEGDISKQSHGRGGKKANGKN